MGAKDARGGPYEPLAGWLSSRAAVTVTPVFLLKVAMKFWPPSRGRPKASVRSAATMVSCSGTVRLKCARGDEHHARSRRPGGGDRGGEIHAFVEGRDVLLVRLAGAELVGAEVAGARDGGCERELEHGLLLRLRLLPLAHLDRRRRQLEGGRHGWWERVVVVNDQAGGNCGAERCARTRRCQRERNGDVALAGHAVVLDRDGEGRGLCVGGEGDRLLEGSDPRRAGALHHNGLGGGQIAGAREGDGRLAIQYVCAELALSELEHGLHGMDRQGGGAGRAEGGARRGVGQTQVDGLVSRRLGVVEDGNTDLLRARVAGGPVEGLGDRRIVDAGMRSAVARVELNRDGAGAALGASHQDCHFAGVFAHAVRGSAELEGCLNGVIIIDGQDGRARAAELCASSRGRDRNVHGLRPAGQSAVEDRNADVLGACVAGGPVEGLGKGRVIGACSAGAVARGELDRNRAG